MKRACLRCRSQSGPASDLYRVIARPILYGRFPAASRPPDRSRQTGWARRTDYPDHRQARAESDSANAVRINTVVFGSMTDDTHGPLSVGQRDIGRVPPPFARQAIDEDKRRDPVIAAGPGDLLALQFDRDVAIAAARNNQEGRAVWPGGPVNLQSGSRNPDQATRRGICGGRRTFAQARRRKAHRTFWPQV